MRLHHASMMSAWTFLVSSSCVLSPFASARTITTWRLCMFSLIMRQLTRFRRMLTRMAAAARSGSAALLSLCHRSGRQGSLPRLPQWNPPRPRLRRPRHHPPPFPHGSRALAPAPAQLASASPHRSGPWSGYHLLRPLPNCPEMRTMVSQAVGDRSKSSARRR